LLQDKNKLGQKEFIGVGCINNIKEIIKETRAKKILLVTGKQSYICSNAKGQIDEILNNAYTEQFNQFEVNPKLDDVYIGVRLLKNTKFNLIIAIGGGSVIDMAKLINILGAQENNDLVKYINGNILITEKGLPLIAIPTTAGTGSEATHFSVVYVDSVKHSLAHQFMLPDYAIVDAELSYSLPSYITAASGIDALSQAVESYWSVKSTQESKKFASEAIVLILEVLQSAVVGDKKSRIIMSKAAHLAGKAINITTTTAPHAISYPITTFHGLAHGHAVGLTLGAFFEINSSVDKTNVADPRGVEFVTRAMEELFGLFGKQSARGCNKMWRQLMRDIGLDTNLEKIGIVSNFDVDRIIKNVNLLRMENNPVKISKTILVDLFRYS
jgi:alcohol dehydrogenase class IV